MRPVLGVVTAWAAISVCGVGDVPLTPTSPTALSEEWPDAEAYLATEFDVEERLGSKGTASMDRSSALAVGVTAELLAEMGITGSIGVVLGTTSGSSQTQYEFTRDSLTRRKPYFVNPAVVPFALMNSAASQCAIWHGITGPNSTIAAGRLSGLSVLRYGGRLLARGRADAVVCGAVEEHSPTRAWLQRHREGDRTLGEGAAVMLLEKPGTSRRILAEAHRVDTRVAVDGDRRAALAACVRRTLDGAGIRIEDVAAVSVSAPGEGATVAERAALHDVFGETTPKVIDPQDAVGDVGAAIGPFQLAAVLDTPGWVLLTALDEDGTVGSGLIRVPWPQGPGDHV